MIVDLTQDDIKTPSPKLQLSSPSAPNAPSKTPITKNTSSSSIDYIPKSPTSSTSLSPNGYLNSPTSPPLRVSPPPPTQENASMDITLTLLPITPLDVQFNTPSPSPPIVDTPYWKDPIWRIGITWSGLHNYFILEYSLTATEYGVQGFLDMAYWMEIMLLQNVDQSIIYGISADVDTAYSSKSGNGHDLV
ncbi:hypothetical protein Tco_0854261 [Tanacetum coccineum]